MSDLRERLNGTLNGNDEVGPFGDRSKYQRPKVGANQKRPCIRFVPLPTNTECAEGEGVDLPYSHHCKTRFNQDFSQVTVYFTADKVTITGRNLQAICDGIAERLLDLVEQADDDPLQAAARLQNAQDAEAEATREVVTGLKLESLAD